jgi:hypothetical protein
VNKCFIDAHNTTIQTRAKKPESISMCFAIMETEAWFLGLSHIFEKMDARLTHPFIHENTKHDLETNDPEKTVFHPATTLSDIYNLIGQKYRKHEGDIEAILNLTDKTDFEYLLSSDKCQSFNQFHAAIHA